MAPAVLALSWCCSCTKASRWSHAQALPSPPSLGSVVMRKPDERWTLHAASTFVSLLGRSCCGTPASLSTKIQGLPYDAKGSAMLTATEEKVTLSPRSDGQAVSGLG
eukprot:SM000182S03931  [mRNA]  locus=s182:214012:214465:+ [translate_table: standard]